MDAKDIALIKALGGGGSGGSVTVDSELSDTSTNPVQNKVIKSALDAIHVPDKLPNPNALTFTGAVTGSYDGSASLSVEIPSAVTDVHINSLIDTKLGVIENGSY